MNKLTFRLLIVFVAVLWLAQSAVADPPPGRLFFLGVAYDESPPQGQTVDHYNYAPDNFARLFSQQSKTLFYEIKVDTLKGNAATKDAVLQKLKGLRRVIREEDLVFLYWGTHGHSDEHGWSASLPEGGQITGAELKEALKKLPCPVVVAISTCGSGGFVRPAKTVELPDNVAAFSACQRKQTTHNELDVSLLEALAGFADLNGDGQVTVREALEYVPVRYNHLNRDSDHPDLKPVVGSADEFERDLPLTKTDNTLAAVVYQDKWYGASILERISNDQQPSLKVRYLGWDSTNPKGTFFFPDETVRFDRVDLAGGYPPVEVEWEGTWYPAKILERAEQGYRIHYIGFPTTDDEVVLPKRIRFPFVGGPEILKPTQKP